MRKVALCLAAGLLAGAISACGGPSGGGAAYEGAYAAIAAAYQSNFEEAQAEGPERAAIAIHEALGNDRADRVSEDDLDEVFGLAPYMVVDAVAYVTDITRGLSEVTIVEPAPGMADEVREVLNQYRISRAASFRNYDILNAYSIASNAVVFNQGDYVVMLMLPDNEAAREILDQYLPS